MFTVFEKDMVDLALAEVGYQESNSFEAMAADPAGGGWTNTNKYAQEMLAAKHIPKNLQGQAYCALGIWWLAWKLGGEHVVPNTAYCKTGVKIYKLWERWSSFEENAPTIGAQVFFGEGGEEHTALVYAVSERHIATVDFNSNPQNWPPVDYAMGVYLRVRDRFSPYIHGYGYPRYGEQS